MRFLFFELDSTDLRTDRQSKRQRCKDTSRRANKGVVSTVRILLGDKLLLRAKTPYQFSTQGLIILTQIYSMKCGRPFQTPKTIPPFQLFFDPNRINFVGYYDSTQLGVMCLLSVCLLSPLFFSCLTIRFGYC